MEEEREREREREREKSDEQLIAIKFKSRFDEQK